MEIGIAQRQQGILEAVFAKEVALPVFFFANIFMEASFKNYLLTITLPAYP